MREVGPLAARRGSRAAAAPSRAGAVRSRVDAHAGPDGRSALGTAGWSIGRPSGWDGGSRDGQRPAPPRQHGSTMAPRRPAPPPATLAMRPMRARRACGRSTRWRWPRETPPTPVEATPEPGGSGGGAARRRASSPGAPAAQATARARPCGSLASRRGGRLGERLAARLGGLPPRTGPRRRADARRRPTRSRRSPAHRPRPS
jgi:hypothetical protein